MYSDWRQEDANPLHSSWEERRGERRDERNSISRTKNERKVVENVMHRESGREMMMTMLRIASHSRLWCVNDYANDE